MHCKLMKHQALIVCQFFVALQASQETFCTGGAFGDRASIEVRTTFVLLIKCYGSVDPFSIRVEFVP